VAAISAYSTLAGRSRNGLSAPFTAPILSAALPPPCSARWFAPLAGSATTAVLEGSLSPLPALLI